MMESAIVPLGTEEGRANWWTRRAARLSALVTGCALMENASASPTSLERIARRCLHWRARLWMQAVMRLIRHNILALLALDTVNAPSDAVFASKDGEDLGARMQQCANNLASVRCNALVMGHA